MVHFVGAGPGAPDLITRRGAALLQTADCIIYAGSLVNPALLGLAGPDCAIYNSAEMTLEQVLAVMKENEAAHKTTVRLHTGDPCRRRLQGNVAGRENCTLHRRNAGRKHPRGGHHQDGAHCCRGLFGRTV